MAGVNDPNFWRRFSVAVHNDDADKEEKAKQPDLKHSYVISLEVSDTPTMATSPTTPHSQTPLTLPLHHHHHHHEHQNPFSPATDTFPLSPISPPRSPKHPPSRSPSGRRLQKQRTKSSSTSKKPPRRPSLAHIHTPFTRHTNGSAMTLGLSGRPPSRFKFWTSVSADPSNRDSWLEGQRRKRRQRSWMCWTFWISVLLLVGGVVAAILILRARGII